MNVQLLKSDIQVELAALERIFDALPSDDTNLGDAKDAIVIGYYLHNLYNAFESIFKRIAESFENHIPDKSRWHSLLLDRMGRNIQGIRPRLLSKAALALLDELRRFRYLFRHLYRCNLEEEGVKRALRQAKRLQSVYLEDIEQFVEFLDGLNETANE